MKNNSKRTAVLSTLACLIPVVLGAVLYSKLPDTIVTHWDAAGNPNGWSSKFTGAILFPGGLLLVNLLVPALLKMDPKYDSMNDKVKGLIYWIIPLVSMFCSGSTLASALGKDVKVTVIAPMMMGVIFIAIGNFLPKATQSYTVGIKLPWTLNSEENWNRTHRMAGFLWVVGGILMVVTGALGFAGGAFFPIVLGMVLIPTAYSYLLFRKGI